MLARVGPPHVPALYDRGTLADGRPYLAMERLLGRTLADEIAGWPAPPSPDVRTLGRALLESAVALSAAGICHRDLKPENVFLVEDAGGQVRARLMDFGLAWPGAGAAPSTTVTDAGAGTPEYMSPERIAGLDGDRVGRVRAGG